MNMEFVKPIDYTSLGNRLSVLPRFEIKSHENFDFYLTPEDEYLLNNKIYDLNFMFKDPEPDNVMFSETRGVYPKVYQVGLKIA
mgnify:CR=1 FL=1